MKLLVLGGTGAIGAHFVELAAAQGVEVHVTSRTRSGSTGLMRYIRGDAHDIGFLGELTKQKWDAIVDFMAYGTEEFRQRVNLLLSSTNQYIFLSSARVFANSTSPITEASPRLLDVSNDREFLNSDEYALAKARQENILQASNQRNWTIVRPYITYASERLQLGVLEKEAWLYRALMRRSIVFCREMIPCMTTMTTGKDVAHVIFALVGRTDALGESFNAVTRETKSWGEILDIYLDCLEKHQGSKPRLMLVGLDDFLRFHPWKYQVLYDRQFNRNFDNGKIARYLDVNNLAGIGEGLRVAIGEFLLSPVFKDLDWKTEAIKDKLANEYTPIREQGSIREKVRYFFHRHF